MIINIRGTSGSGKSTLVRQIMDLYGKREPIYRPNKKRPRGYICFHPDIKRSLHVIGHYEILCGGADTISSLVEQFERIQRAHEGGYDVLCEGLFMSGESTKMLELHNKGAKILVIGIKRALSTCYAEANKRKREIAEARGQDYRGDYKFKNVRGKFISTQRSIEKLRAEGVNCVWLHREQCLPRIKAELGVG